MIEICVYRMRIGVHYGRNFKIKGLNNLSMFEFHIVLCLLLLKSGDVETNPGPFSESSDSFSDLNHTASENQIFESIWLGIQTTPQEGAFIVVHFIKMIWARLFKASLA